ncbi:MAG: hypothetical protein Q9209_004524 [Squamulea sp. 1 TL-2023]
MDLPESSVSTLQLVPATESEVIESSTLGSVSWKGPLDTNEYLRREAHLRNQALTRNGGITYWVLVDTAAKPTSQGSRRILASCETIRKRALVAQPGEAVRDVISHGIGSVHCNPAYRGRGFARRMMVELAKILDTWQQKACERADFTVLWSDIGKVQRLVDALSPRSTLEHNVNLPRASLLAAEDIVNLCRTDEANMRFNIARTTSPNPGIRVALIPDAATMQWHHAREEFLAKVLFGKWPIYKGAKAETSDGRKAWCMWTRTFGIRQDEKVLNILRLIIEGENDFDQPASNGAIENIQDHPEQALVKATAAILQAAQVEASAWGMSSIQFWNPSPISVLAARHLDPSVKIIDRHEESLASLRWHGKAMLDGAKIDWVNNEKYGWC